MWVLPLSVLLAASLIGCGSGNQMPNQNLANQTSTGSASSPGSVAKVSADNWQFLLTPVPSDGPFASDIEAVLSLTPDQFAGTAHMIVAPKIVPDQVATWR